MHPTAARLALLLVAALVAARAIQSPLPPGPSTRVTVTLAPVVALVVSTVSVGAEPIVTSRLFDVPPPGAGEKTLTLATPAVAMSAAPIAALSCVLLTNVVGRELPFHFTTEDDTKPVPFTVSVKAGPATVTCAGDSEATDGTGFGGAVTTTTGLVASRTDAPLKRRNS